MSDEIINAFQNALKKTGIVLESTNKSVPPSPQFIANGSYQLSENISLSLDLCNTVAKQTKAFYTFVEFKRLQNTTLDKPIEPEKNDPKFYARKDKIYSPELIEKYGLKKVRLVEATNNYFKAHKDYEKRRNSYQEQRVQIRYIRSHYNFDERGYLEYILDTLKIRLPSFSKRFFFTPRTLLINEEARKKHTFITGGTGSGKSETIKHIIRHYLTKNTEPAIVVLDPHGDLAEDIARFEENATNDRLVYIRPTFFKGREVAINPFDFPDKDEVSLNRGQVQFLAALEQVIGQDLTLAQKAILTPCLGVMLHQDGTTFKDLVRFMDDDKNSSLVKYGRERLPNEQDRDFFRDQFHARNFESTKEALKYRFNEIIRDPIVREFLCNESTVNLPECLEAGKLIVFHFDPEKQTKEAIKTIGQLINAFLISYAIRRKKGQRRPIHLFADECQYFVSPSISEIMGETRKFGLYATLATQRTDQITAPVLDAILGNVGCYMVGRNKAKTAEKMGKELQISPDEIRSLNGLEFFQVELDRPLIKNRISVIGHKFALRGEAWRDVLFNQGKLYYKSDRPTPEYDPQTTSDDLHPVSYTHLTLPTKA